MTSNTIRTPWILWLGLSLILSGCNSPDEETGAQSIGVTVWNEQLELFMEYPQLQVRVPARFAAHLTNLKSFEPVTKGPVAFQFIGKQGLVKEVTLEEPTRPGVFIPEVTFENPEELTLKIRVQSPSFEGQIEVQCLVIYPHDAELSPVDKPEIEDDAITFLKEQQWELPFQSQRAGKQILWSSVSASGCIAPRSDRDALVVPPVAGRLWPPPQGLPLLGQSVTKGQLLGWIEPPLPVGEQIAIGSAQVQTGVSLAQLEERIAQTQAHLAQEQSKLELARQEEGRVRRLLAIEAVPVRRLELAENEIAIRTAALEAAKKSLESLSAVKDRINEKGQAVQQPDHRIALRSPLPGTVVEINVVAGAHVEPNQALFRIIDLSRIWIRADIYETDLLQVNTASGAAVQVPGLFSFEITERNGRLLTIGEVVDPQTRTIPVVWEISNPGHGLKVGMLVQVNIRTGEPVESLAIPDSALFQEENKSVVYVQVAGETFARRIVKTGITDRGWVQILSGLSEGERVVVEGGYEVGLAARSTSLPVGEGHVH